MWCSEISRRCLLKGSIGALLVSPFAMLLPKKALSKDPLVIREDTLGYWIDGVYWNFLKVRPEHLVTMHTRPTVKITHYGWIDRKNWKAKFNGSRNDCLWANLEQCCNTTTQYNLPLLLWIPGCISKDELIKSCIETLQAAKDDVDRTHKRIANAFYCYIICMPDDSYGVACTRNPLKLKPYHA